MELRASPRFPVFGLMNNKIIISIVAVVFIISFLAGNWLNERNQKAQKLEKVIMQASPCNPAINKCQALLQGAPVIAAFLQKPSALRPFEVEVKSDLSGIEDVHVDFRMQSMNMGVNLYRLNKVKEGVWVGSVTLPVCTSRRSDWIAELQISYQGKLWTAEYAFTQSIDN